MVSHQEDWAQLLPMATVVHNNVQNTTMKQTPSSVLMGFTPTLTPLTSQTLGVPAVDGQITWMIQA